MDAELVPVDPEPYLTHPATGELISLDATTDVLVEHLAAIRDLEQELRSAKKALAGELLDRMDSEARWSLQTGGFKVSGDSPAPTTEYDAEALWSALNDHASEHGQPSAQAIEQAFEIVQTVKVRRAGINALMKLGGRVASIIGEHSREQPRDRRVTVKRA